MAKPLPILVAGPMVRRATVSEVHFWFITTIAITNPLVKLYDFGELEISTETQNNEPLQLGEALFLYLLKVVPDQAAFLPHNEIIFYDIGEDVAGAEDHFISLIDEIFEQVTHPDHHLPSFVLQSGAENRLRALYGSCRKIHGPGQDMLVKANHLISETYADTDKRPRVIFLGGDQIYADDVSEKLIKEINRLGRLLIGSKNGLNDAVRFSGDRQPRLARLGFTSTHMHQHLKSLGEFVATYLLAWNGSFWDHINFTVDRRPNEEEAGRDGACSARFVFANCVSYMIFDDHEVTDDWNFDPKWEKYVYRLKSYSDPDSKSVSGGGELASIIAHGLAAFWIFQAYGNNPDDYSDKFKTIIGNYAHQGMNQPTFRKTILGFHNWSFVAPTSPPALFVDARTQRFHHPNEGEQIINYAAISRLRNLLDDYISSILNPLIVMVPTPFFDIEIKEDIQTGAKKKRNLGTAKSSGHPNFDDATKNDAEGFAVYMASLLSLFVLFARKKVQPLVVLCGDVHYAFEQAFEYEYAKHRVVAVQLCSSSLKNQPLGDEINMLDGAELSDVVFGTGRPSINIREDDDGARPSLPQYIGGLEDSGKVVRYNPPAKDPKSSATEESTRRIKINNKIDKFHHYIKLYSNINKSDDYGKYLWKNNLGELFISQTLVSNRFHYDKATDFKTTPKYYWQVQDWPIKKKPD